MSLQRSRHFALALALVLVAAAGPGPSPARAAAPVRSTGDPTHTLVMQEEAQRVAAGLPSPFISNSTFGAYSTGKPSVLIPATVGRPQREIFGFALASSLSDPTHGYPSWNFGLLTTVAFFALHVDSGSGRFVGDSAWNVWNSAALTDMVAFAHARGVKVVTTIDLHDFSSGTPIMCDGLAHSSATIAETVSEVNAKGVDGVNIDYEGQNGSCGTTDPSWARHAMSNLARDLRIAMPSAYISIDTYSGAVGDSVDFFDITGLNAYVDYFFVMTYDMEYSNWHYAPVTCPTFCLGPTSPLTAYYYNDTDVMANYAAAVPRSKVLLGIPYYGRKACVPQAVANADPSSTVVADMYLDASTEETYYQVQPGTYVRHREYRSTGQERWDTWISTDLNCIRELYWDDTLSLGLKYDLVNADGLRGIGIWNLNYGGGATELWTTLYSKFVGCSSSAIGASPAAPIARGPIVNIAGIASGCADPTYRFWVQSPSGTWTMVQDYSTSRNYSWNTTGLAPGTYRFSVQARNSGSPNDFDVYSTMYYTVLAPCTAMTVSQAPTSPQIIGTAITIGAAATGCPSPSYAFWILPPGGSWTVAHAYGTGATYSWSTSGMAAGTYRFSAWARDASSMATWDVYTTQDFTLTPPCASVGVTAAPPSPQVAGAAVTIKAAASACPNPRYRFYIQPPGGAWSVVQDYSTSATYAWDTSTLAPGNYRFSVWASDAASTATYDAYGTANYLVTRPCSGLTLSTTPNVTSITIGVSSAGCPNPLYRFWLQAPGGSWQMVQDYYIASSTYAWNTAHLAAGTYRWSVWAKDATSPATYDIFSTTYYTFAPCTSVSVSASPASPRAAGTSVTVTALAAGCTSPRYRFWIQPPGGSWSMVRDYATSAAYAWTTTGLAAGAYRFSVQVLDASSGSSYDTYNTLYFTLS